MQHSAEQIFSLIAEINQLRGKAILSLSYHHVDNLHHRIFGTGICRTCPMSMHTAIQAMYKWARANNDQKVYGNP